MRPAGTQLQWPRGGPQAIADALVRGLRKHGGKLLLNCHVQQLIQGPGGKAAGVQLRDGSVVRARRAVVSNASTWDTQKLLPQGAELQEFSQQVRELVANCCVLCVKTAVSLQALCAQ
jgi:phytoene dehydrogenase-like protein